MTIFTFSTAFCVVVMSAGIRRNITHITRYFDIEDIEHSDLPGIYKRLAECLYNTVRPRPEKICLSAYETLQ